MRRAAVLLAGTLVATGAVTLARPAGAVPGWRVGVAVVDITPHRPQYLGGDGMMAHPTARVHDPLQVRAFVVERGRRALAFAAVDAQGWFAGYREGPYGISAARAAVAGWLDRHGFPGSGPADVMVSATHSHAAPTLMGIWGPTDVGYLRAVERATVRAVEAAAAHARPATLWSADADVAPVDGTNVAQTDSYDGWTTDPDAPLLWARDARTGRTIGFYGNVPVHADITDGSVIDAMSADHVGVERTLLDRAYGGTAVIAMGTIGREEAIVQAQQVRQSQLVGAWVVRGWRMSLRQAEPVTGGGFGAAETYVRVPGTNAALLGLITLDERGPVCTAAICTIDRAAGPPYLTGTVVGTWVTAFRIGRLLYVSEPGEAFPEVSAAIRASVPGATVRVVGMAQDQLGYYWPAADGPYTAAMYPVNGSDHFVYNTSVELADESVAAAVADARALGLAATFTFATPGWRDPARPLATPGVQFFAFPGSDGQVLFDGAVNAALDGAPLRGGARPVRWSFGDGSRTSAGPVAEHRYRRPGRYVVTATVTDSTGAASSYRDLVTVG